MAINESQREKQRTFIKIINWLDRAADVESQSVKNKGEWLFSNKTFIELLEKNPDLAILTHWLIYICDYRRNADILWEKGGQIITEMVKDIFVDKKPDSESEILDLIFNYRGEHQNSPKLTRFVTKNEKINYCPFNGWNDFYGFLRTIIYLFKENLKLTDFIVKSLEKTDKQYSDAVKEMFLRMYFLSYFETNKASFSKKRKESGQDDMYRAISEWWNEGNNNEKSILIEKINEYIESNLKNFGFKKHEKNGKNRGLIKKGYGLH